MYLHTSGVVGQHQGEIRSPIGCRILKFCMQSMLSWRVCLCLYTYKLSLACFILFYFTTLAMHVLLSLLYHFVYVFYYFISVCILFMPTVLGDKYVPSETSVSWRHFQFAYYYVWTYKDHLGTMHHPASHNISVTLFSGTA